ncbi:MAG TPA: DUF1059 domain-containing protein [Candidatus Paceibacterota bacterium]|jgi:hypothetical protein|nr:DUF1059 domain-containing protein [Candidatus Paceibacterota bacterium]
MKKLTCAMFGGPCDAVIIATDKDDAMKKGMDHVRQAHPEMVHDIENMTPEQNTEWQAKFDAMWDAAPDMTEEEIEETKNVVMM